MVGDKAPAARQELHQSLFRDEYNQNVNQKTVIFTCPSSKALGSHYITITSTWATSTRRNIVSGYTVE